MTQQDPRNDIPKKIGDELNLGGHSAHEIIRRHVPGPVEPQPWQGHDERPEDRAERLAMAQRNREGLWLRSLKGDYHGAALSDLRPWQDEEHTGQWAARTVPWLDSDAKNMLLSGPSGLGKTHTIGAVGNEAVFRRGLSAMFWTVPELMSALRQGEFYDPLAKGRAMSVDLLCLDELGAENVTGFVTQELRDILNHRNSTPGLRTIVATNLISDEVVALYGSAVLDRLIDRALVLKYAGVSRRRQVGF